MGRKQKYQDEYHKKKREGMRRLRRKQRIHRFSRYAGDRDGLSARDIDFMDNLNGSHKHLRKVIKEFEKIVGIKKEKRYSPYQASIKFGIDLKRIYKALKSGKLKAECRLFNSGGGRYLIPESAIKEFRNREK